MTPAEREDLRDLTHRLFGIDGQGGAIGALVQTLNAQNQTLELQSKTLDILMNDKRVAENALADRRRRDDRRETTRLAIASLAGGVIASVLGALIGALAR